MARADHAGVQAGRRHGEVVPLQHEDRLTDRRGHLVDMPHHRAQRDRLEHHAQQLAVAIDRQMGIDHRLPQLIAPGGRPPDDPAGRRRLVDDATQALEPRPVLRRPRALVAQIAVGLQVGRHEDDAHHLRRGRENPAQRALPPGQLCQVEVGVGDLGHHGLDLVLHRLEQDLHPVVERVEQEVGPVRQQLARVGGAGVEGQPQHAAQRHHHHQAERQRQGHGERQPRPGQPEQDPRPSQQRRGTVRHRVAPTPRGGAGPRHTLNRKWTTSPSWIT